MAAPREVAAALGIFGTGLSQNARLITLATAQDAGLPESLVAERFTGSEGVNELFCFDIDALSTSADLDLDLFIGEEITVNLLLADGGKRAWHGICTKAAWTGADGGVARYRLRLEPALALLRARRDSYMFQDKTVQDIAAELLADYPQLRVEFNITEALTQHAVWSQQRESDYAFFCRLLAEEGLSWRFGHAQDGDEVQANTARHWLVIFDSKATAPDLAGERDLRFHAMRATEQRDAIDQFEAARAVQTNAVVTSSWDPQHLFAPSAEVTSNLSAGELPVLPYHNGNGEQRHVGKDAPELHALRTLQAFELGNKIFNGEGAVRQLAPGHAFELTQHANYEGDSFVVLSVQHRARNNIDSGIKRASDALADAIYRNTFTCVRDSVAIVTGPRFSMTASGAQPALVVGLPNAIVTTNRDHQVKVQFAWQRGMAPNAGGRAHDTDQRGNAPGNETTGTWVRVAESLAGPNWGTQFSPRVGSEVLVDFIEGDINRPVIVSQLYTGQDLPPFSAGTDSSANHAGALSGIHTHQFDGAGYSQWQLDDTQGQLRMRLATSLAATQLNMGYLIAQPAPSSQRGSYRGSGFELRTDAWAVLRGGGGVFISTSARAGNESGVTSTQFDAAEALGQFKGSRQLEKVMTEAARQQNALVSKAVGESSEAFIALLDPQKVGKAEATVNGQKALKPQSSSRELDPQCPVEQFGAPLVVLDAPSAISWATPASTVVSAAQQIGWTSQSDVHFAAGHTIALASAKATGFFTHSGGIHAFAGNGALSLQAHTDQLEILADKEITVVSVNGDIQINAKEKIVLQAGQSSITLEGGDITFACPGNFTVKGGKHLFDKGKNGSIRLYRLPNSNLHKFDEQYRFLDPSGHPMKSLAYSILTADGEVKGTTKANGDTSRISTAEQSDLNVVLSWLTIE
ncbi:MAG: type VI secretion system Vgr family protein [Massilia sp.]